MGFSSDFTFQVQRVPQYCEMAKSGTVLVFDTETTGFRNEDEVVQLAVVALKNGKEQFAKAVYLANTIPLNGMEASAVNGITDEKLKQEGLNPKVVLNDFLSLMANTISKEGRVLLVAHNLAFDWRMMANMFRRYGCQNFPKEVVPCCTKEFVKALQLPQTVLLHHRLLDCIEAFKLAGRNSHDALDDAKACAELFKFLTN